MSQKALIIISYYNPLLMSYLFHSEILNERKSIYARKYQKRRAIFAKIAGYIREHYCHSREHYCQSMHYLSPVQMSIMPAAIDIYAFGS